MKNTRNSLLCLAACGLVLGLASNLSAQTSQGKITVIRKHGDARYTDGKNGWKPVKVGDVYQPGTILQTEQAKGSYVDVVLGDPFATTAPTPVVFNPSAAAQNNHLGGGASTPAAEQNVVRLWENTMMGVDKLTAEQTGADVVTDTQLDLKSGHILGMVKKMSRSSRYEIKLPNGVAGIRGTIYEQWANGSSMVRSGSLVISLLDKQGNPITTVLNGDERYDADTGVKTPISDAMRADLDNAIANLAAGAAFVPPPIVAPDTTVIYYISPTKGKGNNKGKGKGTGGNGGGAPDFVGG